MFTQVWQNMWPREYREHALSLTAVMRTEPSLTSSPLTSRMCHFILEYIKGTLQIISQIMTVSTKGPGEEDPRREKSHRCLSVDSRHKERTFKVTNCNLQFRVPTCHRLLVIILPVPHKWIQSSLDNAVFGCSRRNLSSSNQFGVEKKRKDPASDKIRSLLEATKWLKDTACALPSCWRVVAKAVN